MEPGHHASSDFFESDCRSRRATQCDVRDGLIGDRSRSTDVAHGGRRDAHNDWAHFRYHGCGSHCSAIWLRMFCRVRRSTSRTSRCFVRGSSLKDSIRQYRFPVTSLVARKMSCGSSCCASAASIAPTRQRRPSTSRNLPLHHCCSVASRRSTFPSFSSRGFLTNSRQSSGISALRDLVFLERVRPQSPSAVVRLRRPTRANRS
jgi:hypothetical protein